MTMPDAVGVDFTPSKLGTKEHWDEVYAREIGFFQEIADEGEVWFGEDVLDKTVNWVLENLPSSAAPFILDIGTGNGVTLFALAGAGYVLTRLAGVDYSAPSIQLAASIAGSRDLSNITFQQCDVLHDTPEALPGMKDAGSWDLLLDKGTFDAVSLASPGDDKDSPSQLYPRRVSRLLRPGGLLLITSCNFTEAEIRQFFEAPDTQLQFQWALQL